MYDLQAGLHGQGVCKRNRCGERRNRRFLGTGHLLRGGGGATKREGGGAREVLPLRKRGAEKVLAMLKGGHKKCWGCFTW